MSEVVASQWQRTTYCANLSASDVDKEVVLMGWVQRNRDLGGLVFLDVRDRSGIVQVVFDPGEVDEDTYRLAKSLRSEYVVGIKGRVTRRAEDSINPQLKTGEVEIRPVGLELLNKAKTPPFYIKENIDVDETTRLKYRYLDLRRPDMQEQIILRHRITKIVRDYLDDFGFYEIETPMLTKSTPEGARDYLVPSRVNPGKFYALPQSPQLFKQLLMVSGFDKYFQITRCFRDEDLRADRQPEFSQIDLEMSFVRVEDVIDLVEGLMVDLYAKALNQKIKVPFSRITYQEAMDKYGVDKPDLRFGMEIVDVSSVVVESGFAVFKNAIGSGGVVRGIKVEGQAGLSRRELDQLTEDAKRLGAKGLVWIAINEDGSLRSSALKFLSEDELNGIQEVFAAKESDLILLVADSYDIAVKVLGQLRLSQARKLGLLDKTKLAFAWVVDFPLLEWSEEDNRYVSRHHPFTSPNVEDLDLLEIDPAKVRAQAYDLVLNGVEIAGGSIRIHNRELQERAFAAIGFTKEEAESRFGFLLEAFEYGTPPHGGIAFGLDRMVMIMGGRESIRDVIAFPKTASGTDLMVGAPDVVDEAQLDELKLKVDTEV